MTAFGLVLLILGIIGLNVSDEKIIEIPSAIMAIIGGALVVLGVLVWIWRVMP